MPDSCQPPPLFSVIIPAYKVEAFMALTLQSVYRQTEQDWEIIVVNDGSPDGTGEILARETEPRLRIITQPNAGECAARNRGMAEARGTFLAFLDSDDAWRPDHLALAHRFFEENPEYDWYSSRLTRVADIREADLVPLPQQEEVAFHGINWYLEGDEVTRPSCTVVRRAALPQADLFPPGVRMHGDCVGWCRMARVHGMMGSLNRSTVLYREWPGAATAAYLRAGRGSSTGVEMDALMLLQQLALDPATPPEGRLFIRSAALFNWWVRIRSASLKPWRTEIAARRPLTGRVLSAWLAAGVWASHFLTLVMGKLIRLRYNRLRREMARRAAQVRVNL